MLVSVFILAQPLAAQELEFPISPTPVGSGARAAGMADAFVAIADDATAASWNPAGLVQLEEPEFAFVGAYNGIRESFNDDLTGSNTRIRSSSQSDDNTDINFASLTWSLPNMLGDRNSTLSISYQQRYDLARSYSSLTNISIPQINLTDRTTDTFRQSGQLGTISIAYAIEITSTLSVGVTTNFWRDAIDDSGWKQERFLETNRNFAGTPSTLTEFSEVEFRNFEGENYIIGLLWRFHLKWKLGLRYDTAFSADVDFNSLRVQRTNGAITNRTRQNSKSRVKLPDTLALGLSYRANDRLTFSLDVTRTDWNDLYLTNAAGDRISMVDNQVIGSPFDVDFDETYTVRLGTEYVFIPDNSPQIMNYLWILRGGLFFDQEPASGRSRNLLVVDDGNGGTRPNRGSGDADDFYGVTFGIGLLAHQRFNFDFAYQYRWGNNVNSDYIQGRRGFNEDVQQHRILLSTVIYF